MAILQKAPTGAKVFDLDQARAARAEARAASGEPNPLIKLAAGYVEVKPEFDITVGETLASGRIRDALLGLLLDPADVDVLTEGGLSAQDLNAIVQWLGATMGESLASLAS